MRELVSIIVPVFKVEKYIKRCLDSISCQTYENLEILVVDDGSPDKSLEICKECASIDPRIIIISKSNGGLASARNAALEIAKGRYIACVDSDDWIEPNMIETLVNNIENNECDLSVCDYFIEKNGKNSLRNTTDGKLLVLDSIQAMKYALLPKYFYGFAWNKLYKRELIGTLRYFEEFRKGEDSPFSCEYISRCNKVVYQKTPLYHYRMDTTSITRSSFSPWKLSVLDSYLWIIKMLKEKNYHNDIIKIQEARYANQMLSLASNIISTDYVKFMEAYKDVVKKMKEYKKIYFKSDVIDMGHKMMYFLAIYNKPLFRLLVLMKNK